jgi:hypothetical protein
MDLCGELINTLDTVSLVKQMRIVCIKFSTLRTEFSLSLTLLYGLSEWKRLLYFFALNDPFG